MFLPAISLTFMPDEETMTTRSNLNNFLTTMSFYILPFLFAVNYSFDFAPPKAKKKYYITDINSYVEEANHPDGIDISHNIFYLTPVDKDIKPPFWVKFSEAEYREYRRPWRRRDAIVTLQDNRQYSMLDVKMVKREEPAILGRISETHFDYYALLFGYRKDALTIDMNKSVLKRYHKGGYLTIETYSGLLGIEWEAYR